MKDIKTLYLTAKSSGSKADISAYTEAIQELFENNPSGYISQLEYIISSDIGFQTFNPFIEKYGLPIACYDDVINSLNECVRKCEIYKKDASMYFEAIDQLESFRSNYLNCFMMFENYSLDMKDNYVKTYYGKNKNGHQNRKLVSGMINTFGESAIPDLLITAESMGEATVKTVLEFIADKYNENCATIYEWVLTACNDIYVNESCKEVITRFEENCLSTIVNRVKDRENQLFKESMIMNRDDLMMEYSEDEINAIQELIMFKEYKILWADEFTEKSHGKLKYAYRAGYDFDTGHALKVVYSLDNAEITNTGKTFKTKMTDEEKKADIKNAQNTIRKKGHLDHQSKGGKVVAIIDRVTGENIERPVRVIGAFAAGTKNNTLNIRNKIDNIKQYPDYVKKNVFTIKVNEIDNTPSFKSTHWFTKMDNHALINKLNKDNPDFINTDSKYFDDNMPKFISPVEMLRQGRGAKLNNINWETTSHGNIQYKMPKHEMNKLLQRQKILFIQYIEAKKELNKYIK